MKSKSNPFPLPSTSRENSLYIFGAFCMFLLPESVILWMNQPIKAYMPSILLCTRRAGGIGIVAALCVASAATNGSKAAESFSPLETELAGLSSSSVVWGDFNNDGYQDLVLAGQDNFFQRVTHVYQNNGDGTFGLMAELHGVASGSLALADYNNDSWLDVLVSGQDGNFNRITRLYRNDGDGTFSEVETDFAGLSSGSAAWGDFDNDGLADLVVCGEDGSLNKRLHLYRNNGDETFQLVNAGLPGVANGAVAWGDYDNDGDLDLLLTGQDGTFTWISRVYRNDEGGRFTNVQVQLPGVAKGSVDWGDYDNDGRLDIAITGALGSSFASRILRNRADGRFVDSGVALPGVEGSGNWGDYNNDHRMDLLLVGSAVKPLSAIYRNDGNGVLKDSGVVLQPVTRGQAAWGDWNSDGNLDVLIAGRTNNSSRSGISLVFNNIADPGGSVPRAPAGLNFSLSGEDVVLSWQGSEQTLPGSVSYNVRVGTTPGGNDVISPLADANGFRKVARMGNAQLCSFMRVRGLEGGETYFWSVQAVNGGFAGGPFAPEQSFVAPSGAPAIQLQPQSQTVLVGETATFSITTAGKLPITYEWRHGETTLTNVTLENHTSFFTIPSVVEADAGEFTVAMSNEFSIEPVVSAPAQLTVLADSDGDGIPDEWENLYGMNPNDPTDAEEDSDGDGLSDLAEYLAGTDPTESVSALRLRWSLAGGGVQLELDAVSNRTYTVQYKPGLGSSDWLRLEDIPALGTNGVATVLDPGPIPEARFYRVVTPRQQ